MWFRNLPIVLLASWALFCPWATAIADSCVDRSLLPVSPDLHSLCLDPCSLPEVSCASLDEVAIQDVDTPLYGEARLESGLLCYYPNINFWSLGADHFSFRFEYTEMPGNLFSALVPLEAGLAARLTFFSSFDTLSQCDWDPEGSPELMQVVVRPEGSASFWLQILDDGIKQLYSPAYLAITREEGPHGRTGWPESCGDPTSHGTVDDCFCLRLARESLESGGLIGEVTLLQARFESEDEIAQPSLEIRARAEEGSKPQVRAKVFPSPPAGECATPWATLGAGDTDLRLDFWRARDGREAGLLLLLDNHAVASLRCESLEIDFLTEVRLGRVATSHAEEPEILLDSFGIADRAEDGASIRGWALDTVECEGTDLWSEQGVWPPEREPAAALAGDFGLAVDLGAIAGSSPAYGFLHDPRPEGWERLHLRFLIDPHDVELGNGNAVILAGASSQDSPHGGEHVRLKLRGLGGQLELRIEAKDDDEQWQTSGWTPLPPGEHVVDLQWWLAIGAGTPQGRMRLWLDGELREELFGIDLDPARRQVESFRIGGIWVPPSALGTLYLDDIESWR